MHLKYSVSILIVLCNWIGLHAQFAPAAGQPGTTAIHKDSAVIVAWATGIQVTRGLINISDPNQSHEGSTFASFGVPENALGLASGTSEDVVSLGDGGVATLTFHRPIKNGNGPDFCIFENAFNDTYLELAFVEVSSDGERFVRFPGISLTQTDTQVGPFGALDPTKIHNLAGKYRQGFGTPFDLQDLADSSGIDLDAITHVRIIDVVGSINLEFSTFDSQGHIVNDLFPTPFFSGGFDLDAVGVIHQGTLNTSAFESPTFSIYPNPNHGTFRIVHIGLEVLSYSIYDALGNLCAFKDNMQTGEFYIAEDLNSGIYCLQIESIRGISQHRFVVNRE